MRLRRGDLRDAPGWWWLAVAALIPALVPVAWQLMVTLATGDSTVTWTRFLTLPVAGIATFPLQLRLAAGTPDPDRRRRRALAGTGITAAAAIPFAAVEIFVVLVVAFSQCGDEGCLA